MRLTHLNAVRYRSLRDIDVDVATVNVLIGANASGKSNVLDALRFLSDGLHEGDFDSAVRDRGGMVHLAWKGEFADEVRLEAQFEDQDSCFTWTVELKKRAQGADVHERVSRTRNNRPLTLLESKAGRVWWRTAQAKDEKLESTHRSTVCALAEAAADESFEARSVAQFIGRWGFFDPSPNSLRRAASSNDEGQLWTSGANLAARLRNVRDVAPDRFERIRKATERILGVPSSLTFHESEDGRVYFLQDEPGLKFPVHQVGASSGTLRMLALMTALYGEDAVTLVGIEEPENYVHPRALRAFAEYLRDASESVQLVITTHSPLLLDAFAKSGDVVVVRRTVQGTKLERVSDPARVDQALDESGFGLGQFFETQGFGA
ncbi:MAG: AAA family ATPase [Polyangiaceae bacterium]